MSGPSYAAWASHGSKFGNLTLVDTVPPEMTHLIDPHWYQFPPINPLWYPMVGFITGLLGLISVIGNGMVVYIFCSTKSLRTPSNMFVINLAFSDFLMMFTMSPLLGSLFGCGSIWTMTLIAFDRYNVIVKGLSGKPLSINGALLRILAIWTFSIFWTVAPLLGWGR